jgi:hypothetical protein
VLCFLCFTFSAGAKGRLCGGFEINAFGNKPSKNEVLCKFCCRHFQFLKLISFMSPENENPGSLSIDFLTDMVEGNSYCSCSTPCLPTRHFSSFEKLCAHKPSVAAIDGVALGGGLEVAMVCNMFRLCCYNDVSNIFSSSNMLLFIMYWMTECRFATPVFQHHQPS